MDALSHGSSIFWNQTATNTHTSWQLHCTETILNTCMNVLLCSCWPACWPPLCYLLGSMACCESPHSCHHKCDGLNLKGQKHQIERDTLCLKTFSRCVANHSHLWTDLHFAAHRAGNNAWGDDGVPGERRYGSPHNCSLRGSWLGPACWEGSHTESVTKGVSNNTER